MNRSKFPFNVITFDLKRERKPAELMIRDKLDPVCVQLGYRWTKGNRWTKEAAWCNKNVGLSLTTVGQVKQPNALGGGRP